MTMLYKKQKLMVLCTTLFAFYS